MSKTNATATADEPQPNGKGVYKMQSNDDLGVVKEFSAEHYAELKAYQETHGITWVPAKANAPVNEPLVQAVNSAE